MTRDPIAIVGIGCRFPGDANDPGAFWRLLCAGIDAIREVPAERWLIDRFYHPQMQGKLASRWGGFVRDIDRFDSLFFGIAPREAAAMDPQQRLLLELAWEALEDGGLVPEQLAGSRTGVFVGISTFDYANIQGQPSEWRPTNPHVLMGTTLSIAANRISYVFDLRGPSMSVDTACSSSLVALHLACRSIWQGESALALVGGVNALLHPETSICFSNAGMLSPDGRCKSFDATADGYVRSEGGGMIVLKPLRQARRDNDRIYAVILGTATNQDGRTVSITVPSGAAQESVVRDAYRDAGVQPHQVQYIEAHGTGTPVGDPIEANALGNVLAPGRPPGSVCWLGSVKSNIGHLEAGAGIVGVIKAALALHHRALPPNLHFKTPNPQIDFERCRLRVVDRLQPWPASHTEPRLAGVNSFGFGGANAHAVLASVEETQAPSAADSDIVRLIPFSARSLAALQATASAHVDWLTAHPETSSADVAYTASRRRSHHGYRFAVVADSVQQVVTQLDAFRRESARAMMSVGRGHTDGVVFVFSGMGPQWRGMGRQLLAQEPTFRDAVEECDRIFRTLAGWSLCDELASDDGASSIDEPRLAQPALFAVQMGLAALWRSWGVVPGAIVGHSVGEVAAACVAGALSLQDAVTVVFQRSRLQQRLRGRGKMLAVGMSTEQAERILTPQVTIASINSPNAVTLSGDEVALAHIAQTAETMGVFARYLQVDVPYHSAHMDELRAELVAALAAIVPRTPSIVLVSTVSGQMVAGPYLDAEYWWRNVRQPVLFATAMKMLLEAGHSAFVEIGPHPVLASSINEVALATPRPAQVFASLRRGDDERRCLLESLGKLYTLGIPVAWERLNPTGRLVRLPGYPWQRERFWRESEESRLIRSGEVRSLCPGLLGKEEHPLLGRPVQSATTSTTSTWHVDLDLTLDHAWLADHRIQGTIVYPAAAYIETALAAAGSTDAWPRTIGDIEFHTPLVLSTERPQALELIVEADQGAFTFFSREEDGRWQRLVAGKQRVTNEPPAMVSLEELRARCPYEIDGVHWYQQVRQAGYHYGSMFQGIEHVWCGDSECVARLCMPTQWTGDLDRYLLHPALLDSGIQLFQGTLPCVGPDRLNTELYVPRRAERVVLHRRLSTRDIGGIYCYCRTRRGLTDVRFFADNGQAICDIIGLRSAPITVGAGNEAVAVRDCLYEYRWLRKDSSAPAFENGIPDSLTLSGSASATFQPGGRWLLLSDQQGVGAALANWLTERGESVVSVQASDAFAQTGDAQFCIRAESSDDMRRLLHLVEGSTWRGMVHLFCLDATDPGDSLGCVSVLHLLHACADAGMMSTRLNLVTRGAQAVLPGETPHIEQTPLWGLGRVIRAEHPEMRCTRLDLAPTATPDEIRVLGETLMRADFEDEIALRDGCYVHRLLPTLPENLQGVSAIGARLPFRLEAVSAGNLESLQLREIVRRPPGPTEVEIEIDAAALNFKDVAKALNLLGAESLRDSWSGEHLGMECVGRIIARGSLVRSIDVGAEVVALAPGCFASHVTIDARMVIAKPRYWNPTEACAAPVAFMTAVYALVELARLQPGERVLIHAAAGGVGLAAIQVAQRAGAEVFATAGSDEKRAYLRSIGIEHVMDSRSLNFVDEVLARTGGRGVDVVLNSLTGPAAARSLSILASGGRFLELGKRAIEQNDRLALRPFQNNLAYFAIDLDRLWQSRPTAMQDAIAQVARQLNDGTYFPLPTRVFPIAQAVDAFQFVARAKHIGKVVLSMRDDPAVHVVAFDETSSTEEIATRPNLFRADGTYLITGGLGGFGLATARWLVERGARHLVLLGRRGADSDDVRRAVRDLEEAGTQVLAVAVDVTRADQLDALLETVRRTMPPLRGVLHAAMVLDDVPLLQLDRARFDAVMAPKVAGAWNLHQLTQRDPLDCFVLFSSIATVFGSVGQGNYAAANAYLDGLAHYRRSVGLPALTVNWGPVADVGVVARHDAVRTHLEEVGMAPLPSELMLRALGVLLRRGAIQTTVMRLTGSRLGWRAMAAMAPRLEPLLAAVAQSAGVRSDARSLADRLRAASGSARHDLLRSALGEQVGKALGLAASRLDANVPLTSLGLDSLLAMDLGARLRREIGVEVSVLKLLRGVTLQNLAQDIEERLNTAS